MARKFFQFIPHNINYDFVGFRKKFLFLSGTILIISLTMVGVRGLNFGLDFRGGTEVQLEFTPCAKGKKSTKDAPCVEKAQLNSDKMRKSILGAFPGTKLQVQQTGNQGTGFLLKFGKVSFLNKKDKDIIKMHIKKVFKDAIISSRFRAEGGNKIDITFKRKLKGPKKLKKTPARTAPRGRPALRLSPKLPPNIQKMLEKLRKKNKGKGLNFKVIQPRKPAKGARPTPPSPLRPRPTMRPSSPGARPKPAFQESFAPAARRPAARPADDRKAAARPAARPADARKADARPAARPADARKADARPAAPAARPAAPAARPAAPAARQPAAPRAAARPAAPAAKRPAPAARPAAPAAKRPAAPAARKPAARPAARRPAARKPAARKAAARKPAARKVAARKPAARKTTQKAGATRGVVVDYAKLAKIKDEFKRLAALFKALKLGDIEIGKASRQENDRYEYSVEFAGLSAKLQEKLTGLFGAGAFKILQVESVGPSVGKKLREDGIISILLANLFILIYISIRFDFRYAPGAVAALLHDVFITTGLFSLLQLPFDLAIIAALLTIIGYSLNDTIVVYDRIRENWQKSKIDFGAVMNRSINETLSRTLLTSITTFLAVVPIYIIGGDNIKWFAFAMMFGILIGTYSSIAIASPLVYFLDQYFSRKQRDEDKELEEKRERRRRRRAGLSERPHEA